MKTKFRILTVKFKKSTSLWVFKNKHNCTYSLLMHHDIRNYWKMILLLLLVFKTCSNKVCTLKLLLWSDTICELGGTSELANYGEYSGAPSEQQTYDYARTILQLMCRHKRKEGKVLIIGGGIANFTNVASTFKVTKVELNNYVVFFLKRVFFFVFCFIPKLFAKCFDNIFCKI